MGISAKLPMNQTPQISPGFTGEGETLQASLNIHTHGFIRENADQERGEGR